MYRFVNSNQLRCIINSTLFCIVNFFCVMYIHLFHMHSYMNLYVNLIPEAGEKKNNAA